MTKCYVLFGLDFSKPISEFWSLKKKHILMDLATMIKSVTNMSKTDNMSAGVP